MAERNFFYSKTSRSKSVRKNCFWTEVNGVKYLISYRTVVAAVDKDNYFHKFWNDYSATTLNQVKQFINLFNDYGIYSEYDGAKIKGFNKKEWLEYPTGLVPKDDMQIIKPLLPYIEYNDRNDYVQKIIYG